MATLRRLNYDSSWLLCLPTAEEHSTKTFNIVIDPWLDPSEQVDFGASFSWQRRIKPALASSIVELEALLQDEGDGQEGADTSDTRPRSYRVDAIVLSHPFTDHMHPPTLQACFDQRSIPIFATFDTIAALRKIVGREVKVHAIDTAHMQESPKARSKPVGLPSNVTILQALPQERFSMLKGPAGMAWKRLHGGLVIVWHTKEHDRRSSLVYSPHGLTARSIPSWLTDTTPRALLTSFDRIELPNWLSGTVNLGLDGATNVIVGTDSGKAFPANYLIDTHSEHKEKRGMVASLMRRYWLGKEIVNEFDADKDQHRRSVAQDRLSDMGVETSVLIMDVGQSIQL
jgi:hypothetical protein